jgi:hypothetical protein
LRGAGVEKFAFAIPDDISVFRMSDEKSWACAWSADGDPKPSDIAFGSVWEFDGEICPPQTSTP